MKIEKRIIQISVGIEIIFLSLYRPPFKKKKNCLLSIFVFNHELKRVDGITFHVRNLEFGCESEWAQH